LIYGFYGVYCSSGRIELLVAVVAGRFRASDRALLVALAARSTYWRAVLVLVKPETLLRWLLGVEISSGERRTIRRAIAMVQATENRYSEYG
jgi:hypothetical protein